MLAPPIPSSEKIITNIQISSNKPCNDEYSSNQNLAEIFDVFFMYRGSEYKLYDLVEFLEDKPTVPDRITLLLTSEPSSTKPMQFTVKYFKDGRELDEHNFTTNSLTITN